MTYNIRQHDAPSIVSWVVTADGCICATFTKCSALEWQEHLRARGLGFRPRCTNHVYVPIEKELEYSRQTLAYHCIEGRMAAFLLNRSTLYVLATNLERGQESGSS